MKNGNIPKQRVFSRDILPIFLGIHKVFLRQIAFISQKNPSLLCIFTFFKQGLNHALLNSIFTMFYVEASGFGRGLGVLDINKDSISRCYMLNPKLVSKSDSERIMTAFEQVKSREIMKVSDELKDESRLAFEHEVMRSFGIDEYFNSIKTSLLSMQECRATARKKQ